MRLSSVALALTAALGLVAAQSYPAAPLYWTNATNPFAPVAIRGYGLPCVEATARVVIYPVLLDAATSPNTSAFVAYPVNGGPVIWTHTFDSVSGHNGELQGQYCAARDGAVFLAGGLAVRSVSVADGTLLGKYDLSPVPSSLPTPKFPPIPVVDTNVNVYVAYGAALHVFNQYLNLKYRVGRRVYQHVDVFDSGIFYYNDLLANGRHGAVAASVRDGSTIWQTSMNSDTLVATASVVTVASNELATPVVTAYASLSGKKLWTTTDYADYDAQDGHFVGVYTVNPNDESGPNWTFTARELATGDVVWNTTVAMTSPPTVMGSGHVFTHGHANNGYLTAVRVIDGSVAWQVEGAKGCTSYNGVAFEKIYFAGATGSCAAGAGVFAYVIA